jgi:hypothetical protein
MTNTETDYNEYQNALYLIAFVHSLMVWSVTVVLIYWNDSSFEKRVCDQYSTVLPKHSLSVPIISNTANEKNHFTRLPLAAKLFLCPVGLWDVHGCLYNGYVPQTMMQKVRYYALLWYLRSAGMMCGTAFLLPGCISSWSKHLSPTEVATFTLTPIIFVLFLISSVTMFWKFDQMMDLFYMTLPTTDAKFHLAVRRVWWIVCVGLFSTTLFFSLFLTSNSFRSLTTTAPDYLAFVTFTAFVLEWHICAGVGVIAIAGHYVSIYTHILMDSLLGSLIDRSQTSHLLLNRALCLTAPRRDVWQSMFLFMQFHGSMAKMLSKLILMFAPYAVIVTGTGLLLLSLIYSKLLQPEFTLTIVGLLLLSGTFFLALMGLCARATDALEGFVKIVGNVLLTDSLPLSIDVKMTNILQHARRSLALDSAKYGTEGVNNCAWAMLANAFDEEQCLVDVAVESQAATKGTTKTGARARASVLTAQEEKLASNMIEYFRLQPAVFSLVGVTIRDSTLARVAYVFAGFMFFVLQTGGIGVSVFSAG